MRTAFRKSSMLVLGLAVVAALGGLTPSRAVNGDQASKPAFDQSTPTAVNNSEAVDPAWPGASIKVIKIPSVDHAGTNLTEVKLELKYWANTTPPGATTTLTQTFNPPLVNGESFNSHPTGTYTFTGIKPLLQSTDYAVEVTATGNPASLTPVAYEIARLVFSVRTATQMVLSVPAGQETISPLDCQTVNVQLLDGTNKPVIGQKVSVSGDGGIVHTSFLNISKITDGGGKTSFGYCPSSVMGVVVPWSPGSYQAKGNTLAYYSYEPPFNTKVNHYIDSNQITWDVLVPSP